MKTAEELGMHRNAVTRRLRELGFKSSQKADRGESLNYDLMRKLSKQGMSTRAIGKRFGIDHTTVMKVLRGETPDFTARGHLKTMVPSEEVMQAAIAKRQKDMELLENIPNLPPEQRLLIETWIDSDLSPTKAAKKLGLDSSTVTHKIKQAGYQGFEMPVERPKVFDFVPGKGLQKAQ